MVTWWYFSTFLILLSNSNFQGFSSYLASSWQLLTFDVVTIWLCPLNGEHLGRIQTIFHKFQNNSSILCADLGFRNPKITPKGQIFKFPKRAKLQLLETQTNSVVKSKKAKTFRVPRELEIKTKWGGTWSKGVFWVMSTCISILFGI